MEGTKVPNYLTQGTPLERLEERARFIDARLADPVPVTAHNTTCHDQLALRDVARELVDLVLHTPATVDPWEASDVLEPLLTMVGRRWQSHPDFARVF